MKILLRIGFCGKNYHGWQVQDNAVTVQRVVGEASNLLFGCNCNVTGCSRTDTGVHAREYYCTVEPETPSGIPAEAIPRALCSLLPGDISVFGAKVVDDAFHPRYSVKKKTYEYLICDSTTRDPFSCGLVWNYGRELDNNAMNEAAAGFVGIHDFTSFCASGASVESKVREIYKSEVCRRDGNVVFTVTGNGFLYNMVRIMTGTLVGVSEGKYLPGDIGGIIAAKDRSAAGMTAPPYGLYLKSVEY